MFLSRSMKHVEPGKIYYNTFVCTVSPEHTKNMEVNEDSCASAITTHIKGWGGGGGLLKLAEILDIFVLFQTGNFS